MTTEMPSNHRLMAAVDATWPPAESRATGPWLLRRGDGGGQRVSAASLADPAAEETADIAAAEAVMRGWGQRPLFQVTPGQERLDARLAAGGYAVKDPVVLYAAAAAALAVGRDETVKVFRVTAPLAVIDEIWAEGGIGPGRRAVMERAAGPRMTLMARADDRPVGAAFAAVDGEVAMVHAIEVTPAHRQKGGGGWLIRGGASFAAEHGAAWLAMAVTEANGPARALYEKLGFAVAGRYHYRIAPE